MGMMTDHAEHPTRYEIKVAGQLDPQWRDWFDDLDIAPDEAGNTTLRGAIVDQAALFGILKRINKLGLRLISVNPQRDE